jgi:DHA1 family multidrug resistance protein-like MFS transporter
MWFVQFAAVLGFGFSRPFMPFYLEELGLTDPVRLRLWSGMFQAAASVTMIVITPVWGFLADRYGRKPMSLRAALGGAAAMLALGLARSPEALLAIRFVQGLFTGTTTANLALVVTMLPREKRGLAIGVMNSAVFAGSSISPLIGGVLADLVGFRPSFYVASGMLAISFVLVLVLVREDFTPPERVGRSFFPDMGAVLRRPGIPVMILLVIPLYGMARIMPGPVRPLLVRELAGGEMVATLSGLVSSAGGMATVLAGLVVGSIADRGDLRRLALVCSLGAAALSLPVLVVTRVWQLAAAGFLIFFFLGGLDPVVKLMIARRVPERRMGSLFGLMGSARAVGMGLGSLSGGAAAAAFGLRSVYLIGAVFLLVVAVLLLRLRRTADTEALSSAAE